jgi:hypothetical protein
MEFLKTCVTVNRLTASDLLCTYAVRRVLPLQCRAHKIGHMSGRFDPTRTSKVELTHAGVASQVNYISNARLPDDWPWGMELFCRSDPPAVVSLFRIWPACRYIVCLFCWFVRL